MPVRPHCRGSLCVPSTPATCQLRLQLPLDATNLGTFERQIVHQPLLIEDEPDNRTADAIGVDLPACPNRDDRDRSVDADLPAVGALEVGKCRLCHEHDDRGSRLRTELKPDRGRNDVVVAGGAATNVQRAFAIFTANSEARLDDGRENQDCHRLVGKLPPRPDLPEEVFERRADAVKQFLSEKYGIEAGNLVTVGYGATQLKDR